MADPSPRPHALTRADLVGIAVGALLLCGLVAGWWFAAVATAPTPDPGADGRRLAAIYDPPTSAIEAAYDHGDGQLFAALATDPLAQHTEIVRGGPSEQAYRYQRPMYGWVGWVASGGQRDAVAWALVAVTAASGALLVVAGARFLARSGADPRWGFALLLVPGVFVDLTWVGPEVLGTALALLGLDAWRRRRAGPVPIAAIALFAAAGLCRETLLLFPAVLVLVELYGRRWTRAAAVAASAVPYVLWVGFLAAQIGALPRGSVGGRISVVPFGGAVSAATTWTTTDEVIVVLTVVLAAAGLWVARRTYLGALIGAHLLLTATLGEPVWLRSVDFSRVLLPLWVLALVAVIPAFAVRQSEAVEVTAPPADGVRSGFEPALIGAD